MQIVKLFYYLFGIFVISLSFIWSINISNLAEMVLWSGADLKVKVSTRALRLAWGSSYGNQVEILGAEFKM